MKHVLYLIFALLIFRMTAMGQVQSNCDSLKIEVLRERDSLHRFDLFMKDRVYGVSFNGSFDKNYSFGIGYYLYSDFLSRYRRIPSPSFESDINYHLDGYVYHNLTLKIPLLISPSLSFCTYTDLNNTSFFIRPGVGIDAWVASINYSRNWVIMDNLGLETKHNISIYFRLGIMRNVWRDSNTNLSQWDKHKLNRK